MTRRFFSGNSLDQAVLMAARHYEIEPDELAYRQIEKKHGFLRTRKAVMIAVDPEQPRRETETVADAAPVAAAPPPLEPAASEPPPSEESEPADEPEPAAPDEAATEAPEPVAAPYEAAIEPPQPEAAPRFEAPADVAPAEAAPTDAAPAADKPRPAATQMVEPDEELITAAEDASRTLLRFAGIEAEAEARSGGERVEVEIDGADASLLVVEGGKGLLSIQHLLPRMLRGLTGRSSFVRVDSQGFHQQRRERLETLAAKEAEAASRSGRPRTLPPMAPDERRIVHLALKDSPTVVTESRGRGLHKQVVVRPVAGDGGSDDIEARHGF